MKSNLKFLKRGELFSKIKLSISNIPRTIFLLLVLIYFLGFKIYTYGWHLLNPNPISWENIFIKIPSNYVRKKYDNPSINGFKSINLNDRNHPIISFVKIFGNLPDNFDFKNDLNENFIQVEKSKCGFLNENCIWFKSIKKLPDQNFYYTEDVVVRMNCYAYMFSYHGPPSKRSDFVRTLNALKLEKSSKAISKC